MYVKALGVTFFFYFLKGLKRLNFSSVILLRLNKSVDLCYFVTCNFCNFSLFAYIIVIIVLMTCLF